MEQREWVEVYGNKTRFHFVFYFLFDVVVVNFREELL